MSKSRLAERLATHGIAYEHRRELGTPPEIRPLYRSGRLTQARHAFAEHVERASAQSLDSLATELGGEPRTALLCLEADPAHCHRRVLAEALCRRMPGLTVVDL
jgi:uncharacterized protein (DUF488 family)